MTGSRRRRADDAEKRRQRRYDNLCDATSHIKKTGSESPPNAKTFPSFAKSTGGRPH
jgi:hypothetical protein